MNTKNNLDEQIKKYWEDQYNAKRRGQANQAFQGIQNLTDSISPLVGRPNTTFRRDIRRGPVNQQTRPATPTSDANFMNPNIDVDAINAQFRDQLDAAIPPEDRIKAQIDSILNKEHGLPDRWVSPYTQADLNRIGAGLSAAGANAQQQFEASQADINRIYDEAIGRRADTQASLAQQLASNLGNIGIQPGQIEADAVAAQQFLNTVANQNRASDQAFNEKLGTMASGLANQLAQAARAGLLTPKQFVPGTTGQISDADKFRLGMLQDELDASRSTDGATDLTVSENMIHENPLVPELIGRIEDPELRAEAIRLYDLKGTPEGVLAELAERMEQPEPLGRKRRGFWGSFLNPVYDQINKKRQAVFDEQAQQNYLLAQLFRQISPTWSGVPTKRTITETSKS